MALRETEVPAVRLARGSRKTGSQACEAQRLSEECFLWETEESSILCIMILGKLGRIGGTHVIREGQSVWTNSLAVKHGLLQEKETRDRRKFRGMRGEEKGFGGR